MEQDTFEVTLDNSHHEYECSVKLKITEEQFLFFLNQHPVLHENVVCYYKDFRTVDEKCQKKVTLRSSSFSKIIFAHQPFLLPFTVTESLESDAAFDFYEIMHTIKHRHVLFSAPLLYNRQYGYVRIGVEASMTGIEGSYYFVAELETDYSILGNIPVFRNHATSFWTTICKFIDPIYTLLIPTMFDPVAPSSFHAAKSKKFVPIHEFSASKNAIYTYKYDGGKAKLIVNNGVCNKNKKMYENFCMLMTCKSNMYYLEPPEKFLNFPNVIFQLEMMQAPVVNSNGIRNLILVDCCGGIKNGQFYFPFPDESLELLKFFTITNPPQISTYATMPISNIVPGDNHKYLQLWQNEYKLETPEVFRLCCQQKIMTAGQDPIDKIDGKLVMFGHKQSKIKPPTIDVKLVGGYIQFPNNLPFEASLPKYSRFDNYTDGLYEITFSKSKSPQILRLRHDRTQPSSPQAVQSFIKDWEFIHSAKFYNA